jgi:glycosyltransferase involved in cell wall biosynthesis
VISVVTPVYQPRPDHLTEAYASIQAQDLPDEWEWQWVVQEDGTTGILDSLLPADVRISSGQGRHGGAGTARTLALSRVAGELVKVLDADDQLAPGSLARDISIFQDYPRVQWTTSRVLDLLPDGSTVGFEDDPPAGLIARRSVIDFWQSHNFRASVHPATLCLRRDFLLALGGWMALPASEDTGLLLAANAVADGYFIPDTGLLYRKWAGQSTANPAHDDATERSARMQVIADRVDSLAAFLAREIPR